MELILQVLFFFLEFLNLEVFHHQLHRERNLSGRLHLPSGNTMQCSRNTRFVATKKKGQKNLLEALLFFT